MTDLATKYAAAFTIPIFLVAVRTCFMYKYYSVYIVHCILYSILINISEKNQSLHSMFIISINVKTLT